MKLTTHLLIVVSCKSFTDKKKVNCDIIKAVDIKTKLKMNST